MPLLCLTQSAEFLRFGLNGFDESKIFLLVVEEVRLELESCAFGELSRLLLLAVMMCDSNELRVESVRSRLVGGVPHNFIRLGNKYNLHS